MTQAWPMPSRLKIDPFHLLGNSLAGQATSFVIPELQIAFDVGFGLPYLLKANHFFITHAHMDHAGGIPYIISQKALHGQKAPTFYLPELHASGFEKIMAEWSRMEGHNYDFEIVAMRPGQEININKEWSMRAFETVHRVTSLGYTLFWNKKKLKPELQTRDQNKIRELKLQGVTLTESVSEPWFSFTGDTQIEFLDKDTPWIHQSRTLMMEVTYIDAARSIQRAKEWGHIHLDEVWPRLEALECEQIIFIHLSARYRSRDLVALIEQKAPKDWKSKLVVWPRDG